jgi:HAMP domain-containing protein
MTEELVERLRDAVTYGYMPRLMREVAAEAADRIEALQAEIERLTYDGIHTCHDHCPRLPCVQRREIEELQAEVERLREALRACRRAVSAGRDEPRLNVREIVDEAIEEHQRHLMNELQAHKDALAQAAPKP